MKMRNTINSLILSFFLVAGLTSCAGREKQKDDMSSYSPHATFIVEEVTNPLNLDPIILNTKEGLPDSFIVNLKTCIRDRYKKDVSIQDNLFIIEYETNFSDSEKKAENQIKTEKTVSDSDGCIQWQEEYKFRFVKNPVWIGLRRTIRTESNAYFGQVIIPLAVNPWLTESDKNRPAILDVRSQYSKDHKVFRGDKYKKDGLAFLSEKTVDEFPQLWAPVVDVQIETSPQLSEKSDVNTNGKAVEEEERQCEKEAEEKKLSEEEKEKCKKDKQIRRLLKPYQTACIGGDQESCYRRYLKLDLLVPLQLRRYDTKGEIIDGEINGGIYDINVQLILIPDMDKKKNYRMHEKICMHEGIALSEDEKQQTKFLSLNCDMRVAYFNKNVIYKLLIEVKPNDKSNLPFKPFQGAYTLSELDFSGSRQDSRIDNAMDEQYKKALRTEERVNIIKEMDIKDVLNRDGTGESLRSGFHEPKLDGESDFKLSNISNTKNCADNDHVVQRVAVFVGKICLTDTLSGEKYTQTPFRVFVEKPKLDEEGTSVEEVLKGGKEVFATDQQGCISMTIPLKHKMYNRQQYFPVDVHFLSEELNLYGRVRPALNPWQRAFQAHQDATKLHEDEIRFDPTGVTPPQLIVNQFKSVKLFPSYGLDKFLNIYLYHRAYFLFQPFIQRHDNVALSLDHRARELVRDGYYIVRLLLLRNPQETGHLTRVQTEGDMDKNRDKILNEEFSLDIENSIENYQYVTHTDTIMKAEANFVNLYMPLYVNTKQLFYVSSRNILSIEIVPVDPSGFVFKEVKKGGFCELDLEKMGKNNWRAFRDHELRNRAYIGAFNIQNWTNWNILRPSDNLNSDQIIEKSEIGKQYKHFDLHPDLNDLDNQKDAGELKTDEADVEFKTEAGYQTIPFVGCDNGMAKDFEKDPSNRQIEECVQQIEESKQELSLSNAADSVQEEIKVLYQQDLLKGFAKQNALRIVELSKPEGDNFTRDIQKAREKVYLEPPYLKSSEILPLLPEEDQRLLKEQISSKCSGYLWGLFGTGACKHNIIKNYIDQVESGFKNKLNFSDEEIHLFSAMERVKETESYSEFSIAHKVSINKGTIENIINERVSNKNTDKPEVLTFARSLCHFWLDTYLKEYLEKEQMLSAYTNYIRKFDYYRVLETDSLSYPNKLAIFEDFINIAGLKDEVSQSEESFGKCHEEYVKCIKSDHCQLRPTNDKNYCLFVETEESSCKKVLNEECNRNSSFPLCSQRDSANCSDSLNSFCVTNVEHPVCYRFSNRCLVNYNSCVQSADTAQLFDPESIVNFHYMKKSLYPNLAEAPYVYPLSGDMRRKTPSPLDVCLENPYRFFKFENKMTVYDLSDKNPVYKGGYLRNFNTTGNFSLGTYMNWTAQRGNNLSTNVKFPSLNLFVASLDLGVNENMSSNESNSNRRAVDVRAGESILFTVGRATVEMDVIKFQKCLVIKPRPNAFFGWLPDKSPPGTNLYEEFSWKIWEEEAVNKDFKKIFISRPGLILCNSLEEKGLNDAEKITEDYYYISQNLDANNSQFLNLYDLINRPLVNVLRGRKEFVKYYHMMKSVVEGDNGRLDENLSIHSPPENMFINYTHPVEEAVGLSLSIREFNETGFFPGIYDYSEDADEELDIIYTKGEAPGFQYLFEGWRDVEILEIPTSPTRRVPVQEPKY